MFVFQYQETQEPPKKKYEEKPNEVRFKLGGLGGDRIAKLDPDAKRGFTDEEASARTSIGKIKFGKAEGTFDFNVHAGQSYTEKGVVRGGITDALPVYHGVPRGPNDPTGVGEQWRSSPFGTDYKTPTPTGYSLKDDYGSIELTGKLSDAKGNHVKLGLGAVESKQELKNYGEESILIRGSYSPDGQSFMWSDIRQGFPQLDAATATKFGFLGSIEGGVAFAPGAVISGYVKFNTLQMAPTDMAMNEAGVAGINVKYRGAKVGVAARDKAFKDMTNLEIYAEWRNIGNAGLGMGVFYAPKNKEVSFDVSWSWQ